MVAFLGFPSAAVPRRFLTRFRLVVVRDFADVGSGVTPLDGAADTCRLERRTGALFSTNRGILVASMSRTVVLVLAMRSGRRPA